MLGGPRNAEMEGGEGSDPNQWQSGLGPMPVQVE